MLDSWNLWGQIDSPLISGDAGEIEAGARPSRKEFDAGYEAISHSPS